METTVYRLTFKTQLHLGRATGAAQTGSLGLEKTETYISADTLFSAICQTWTTFYDTASLTDFLKPYTEETATLPFMLTSAFPYAHEVYLFPKPMTFQASLKKGKRMKFVSDNIFRNIINGNLPDFDENNLINNENVWVSADEKEQLKNVLMTSEEKEQLKKVKEDKLKLWTISTRPRVTIDRQTNESSIWHVETVQFSKKCGLWFAAKYDSDATKHKIETLLRVLGDCGIGGERSAGYGQFEFTTAELEIPTAEERDQFVTLSPICPKSSTQLQQLLTDDVAYTLSPCIGWVSVPGSDDRRKLINMFTEGSVLHASEERVGRLVDLKPDNYPHPVYRYGYAWQVGIKGAKNEAEVQT